eukprot:1158748-Pelagomonas_calceolata.AAC.18
MQRKEVPHTCHATYTFATLRGHQPGQQVPNADGREPQDFHAKDNGTPHMPCHTPLRPSEATSLNSRSRRFTATATVRVSACHAKQLAPFVRSPCRHMKATRHAAFWLA